MLLVTLKKSIKNQISFQFYIFSSLLKKFADVDIKKKLLIEILLI